jgi:hypothetical protein
MSTISPNLPRPIPTLHRTTIHHRVVNNITSLTVITLQDYPSLYKPNLTCPHQAHIHTSTHQPNLTRQASSPDHTTLYHPRHGAYRTLQSRRLIYFSLSFYLGVLLYGSLLVSNDRVFDYMVGCSVNLFSNPLTLLSLCLKS